MFLKYLNRFTLTAMAIAMLTAPTHSADIKLPSFGGGTSSVISQQQEYELGRAWLLAYRGRMKECDDAVLYDYLEHLIYKLAEYSELQDHRLELIVIDDSSMNAFAVPGGVIGVNTGLFNYAKSEAQLSSVLSHEIAHLSQRHFARRVETQKRNSTATMAGMLGALVLAVTVGGDAGMAAMTGTMAASQGRTLHYSRQNEQEADSIGIQTLSAAGMDPNGMPGMFEQMLQATRYSSKPPEFMLTHPLTEKRVADARSRARQYPPKQYLDNIEYHLMRTRSLIAIDKKPRVSLNRFQHELKGNSLNTDAAQYGLVLTHTMLGDYSTARNNLRSLLKKSPDRLTYLLADIDIDRAEGKFDFAVTKTTMLLHYHPNSYPLKMSLAETYLKANRFYESEVVLTELTKSRPNLPLVWYDLAEVRGLAGNISGVHMARAQYFILNGVFGQARDQLGYARKLLVHDYKQTAIIDQQLRDLAALEKKMNNLMK
ncbi:MAG: M48 family metalloprotease [Porticoccus sp.]